MMVENKNRLEKKLLQIEDSKKKNQMVQEAIYQAGLDALPNDEDGKLTRELYSNPQGSD